MFTLFDPPAEKADSRTNFSRRRSRGYMMRSEKRTPYQPSGSGGKRPRRRKKKAGFFYVLLSLLLSLILWPVGMCMLWRRKVRWTISSKLLTTIITLFLCVTMFGYALTVQTDNVQFTKAQDRINDFIDNGAVYISQGYTAICDGAVQVASSAADLGDAVGRLSMAYLADGIDRGTELTRSAVSAVSGLFAQDAPTAEPVATDVPADVPTETPAVTDAPTDAPEATAETSPEVTGEGILPLTIPEITPDPASAQAIGSGTLNRDGTFVEATATPESTSVPTDAPTDAPSASPEVTAEPTATPEPTSTPEPTNTPEPSPSPEVDASLMPVPASEAVVYYTSNGKYYHMASTCKGMSGAKAHTLEEAVARKLNRCKTCGSPDASILKAENPVWTDEAGLFHLTATCEHFTGTWSLMELDEALASGYTPCEDCDAVAFMAACGRTVPTDSAQPAAESTPTEEPTTEPTEEPTAEPTEEPTVEPSEEPTEAPTSEPSVVTPSRALKPAGEALVYHTSSGGWYHTIANCSKMTGAKLYPLSECVEGSKVYKRCRKCNAPLPEYVKEYCLWMDEQSVCHTTDACPSFTGQWTLIPRDEALEAGHTGCVVCSANEYLQPNTTVNYIEYVADAEIEETTTAE